MESRVYFDAQAEAVVVEVVGAATAADLDALRLSIREQRRLSAADALLVDLSAFDPSQLSSAAVRDRAREPWETFRRVAQVAPRDEVFGLARMYELSAPEPPGKARASFRTRDEAVAWLTGGGALAW